MGKGKVVVILGLGLALLSAGPSARAQSAGARSAATELFDAAERLETAGNFADACPKYQESYRLDPQLGALLHLSDCFEKNKQIASAYSSWREAAELGAQRGDDRANLAKEHAATLEPRVSRLTVNVSSGARLAGLKVTSDGLLIAESTFGIAIPVDGGEHLIEATAPGRQTWRQRVNVAAERAKERVEVPALEAQSTAGSSAQPDSSQATGQTQPAEPRSSGSVQRTLGYVVGGVGVVGLGVGTVFLIKRNGKAGEANGICPTSTNCPIGSKAQMDSLNGEARSAQTLSMIGFIAGGVALTTGLVLVLTAPKSQATDGQASVRFFPALGPKSGGFLAEGRF